MVEFFSFSSFNSISLASLLVLLLCHLVSAMEDLTGRWDNLSLNTKESATVSLSDNEVRNSRVLVAKFFTKRRINLETTTKTLKSM